MAAANGPGMLPVLWIKTTRSSLQGGWSIISWEHSIHVKKEKGGKKSGTIDDPKHSLKDFIFCAFLKTLAGERAQLNNDHPQEKYILSSGPYPTPIDMSSKNPIDFKGTSFPALYGLSVYSHLPEYQSLSTEEQGVCCTVGDMIPEQ